MLKTPQELEALKENWLSDPCWDIEDTEGFENYYEELFQFRKEKQKEWYQEAQKKAELRAKRLGVSIEAILQIESLELTTSSNLNQAKNLLKYYFSKIINNSSELETDIDELCNCLINATLSEAKMEIIKATQKADD